MNKSIKDIDNNVIKVNDFKLLNKEIVENITNLNEKILFNSQGYLPRWPLFLMLSAAIVCFCFSTTYHWFSIYGPKVYAFLNKLDYSGVTFLIPGSCYPPYYYFFYCEKCK